MEEQAAVWRLCHLIASHDHGLRLVVDGESYSTPFDAVVARLVGGDDLRLHQVRLETALATVAAVCGDTAQPAAASRIVDRLRELRRARPGATQFLKQIRQSGQSDDEDDAAQDPTAAAEMILDELERAATADDGDNHYRVLHYFNGEFYDWQQPWKPIKKQEFQATVTKHLQDHEARGGITQRFVTDVLTNFDGDAGGVRQRAPAFLIEEYGPHTVIPSVGNCWFFRTACWIVGAVARGEDANC